MRHQAWLSLLGGLFLCYLGVKTLLSRPTDQSAVAEGHGFRGAYFSTFLLTLTNPITILSFVAVFAGLGVGSAGNSYGAAAAIVVGVFLGSSAWWFLLSGGVSLVRGKFDARAMLWVNRISGLIILGFGIAALFSLLTRK